jgi:uncharacterized protein
MLLGVITGLAIAGALSSCQSTGPQTVNFDRKALLTSYANDQIMPAYQQYAGSCNALKSRWEEFSAAPGTGTLTPLKESLINAWTDWQKVAPLDFGPALDRGLLVFTNTFPADTVGIAETISTGTWNLDQASMIDVQGFPAFDYLLAGRDDDRIVALFTSDAQASDRLAYTSALINRINDLAVAVSDDWQTGYAQSFIEADGVDVGSSLGKLINAANRYLESDLRDGKIGIPLGLRSLGVIQPDRVEGKFSEASLPLFQAAVTSYQTWIFGLDGPGLDDYLDAVDARYGSISLSTEMQDALDDVLLLANTSLADPIDQAVVTQPESVETMYTALQRLLVLFKVDLSSSLGILITYQDSDGD